MEAHIKEILLALGEDPDREGLQRTPARVAESFEYLCRGYKEDPTEVINNAIYHEDQKEMVIVRDIDFFSLCEHHLLPFFGKCHLAYVPDGKIIGLSKLARIVDIFGRRLQVQERLTQQIARTISDTLKPRGVACVMEAEHLCMKMRGVERQNSVAVTSEMLGLFRENSATRAEFLSLIRK